MKDSGYQRARQPAQKEERRQSILEAAAGLLEEHGFQGVSLSAIARRVGIAKSNVYRYFESREAIFLDLLLADERAWVVALERAMVPLAGSDDRAKVARVLAETLLAYPRLCMLTTVLANVLEQNVSLAVVTDFKTQAMDLSIRISNALHAALPSFDYERLGEVQRYVHAVIAGLWPICHPAPVVAEVLKKPEFESFRGHFAADLKASLTALLRGMDGGA